MVEKTEYQRMYPDLPEPVYETLQFERLPEKEILARARDWHAECER